MVSEIEFIKEEIALLRRGIESLEMLKNEAIFKEIASLNIHLKMDKEKIGELIKILKEKIGEIDEQHKKYFRDKVDKELDYWRERAVCESSFLYVLQEKHEEAIALIRKELERGRPLHEESFSILRLIEIFFHRSERSLEDYKLSVSWERERLVRGMSPSTRDRNVKWSLRAAFTYAKCLSGLWEENKQSFKDNGEMTEEIEKENSKLVGELLEKIKNIERKIV